jgi:hypothetical protein
MELGLTTPKPVLSFEYRVDDRSFCGFAGQLDTTRRFLLAVNENVTLIITTTHAAPSASRPR